RIVGEHAGLGIELADVHDGRADRSIVDRKRPALVADGELAGLGAGAALCIHDCALSFSHWRTRFPGGAMASLGESAGKVLCLRRSSSPCALQDGAHPWQRGTAGSLWRGWV